MAQSATRTTANQLEVKYWDRDTILAAEDMDPLKWLLVRIPDDGRDKKRALTVMPAVAQGRQGRQEKSQ